MEVSAARYRPADMQCNEAVMRFLLSYSSEREQATAARLGLACGVHAIHRACGEQAPSINRLQQLARAGQAKEVRVVRRGTRMASVSCLLNGPLALGPNGPMGLVASGVLDVNDMIPCICR